MGLLPLEKETWENLFSFSLWLCYVYRCLSASRRKALTKSNVTLGILTLISQTPVTVRNKLILVKLPSLWHFCYSSQNGLVFWFAKRQSVVANAILHAWLWNNIISIHSAEKQCTYTYIISLQIDTYKLNCMWENVSVTTVCRKEHKLIIRNWVHDSTVN